MKLLKTFKDQSDADHLARHLEAKGVMAHVSSKYSRSLSSGQTGALTSEVWIPLDFQFDDAIGILQNRSHKVENPLSAEQMRELRAASSEAIKSALKAGTTRVLNYLLSALVVAFLAFVAYGVWKNF